MTQRKPEGVTFGSFVEQQLAQAAESGAFTNLPGEGKPLPLAPYEPDWWLRAWVEREGVSLASPVLELRREVERFLDRLDVLTTTAEVHDVTAALNRRILDVTAQLRPGDPSPPPQLAVAGVLARWKAARRHA